MQTQRKATNHRFSFELNKSVLRRGYEECHNRIGSDASSVLFAKSILEMYLSFFNAGFCDEIESIMVDIALQPCSKVNLI